MYKYTYNVESLPIPVIAALVTLVIRFDSIDILKFLQISNDLPFLRQCHNARFIWQGWTVKTLWTYSLTTADYIVPAVLPARANFMAHCDTCMAEWHQQSHKTIHVHRFDKHVDFNKLSFWPGTVTEVQNFLILNNTGLIVAVGKLSEGKTPTVLFQ